MRSKVHLAAESIESINGKPALNTVDVNGNKFLFDGLHALADAPQIYKEVVGPLVQSIFDGYHSSLLMFGRGDDGMKRRILYGDRNAQGGLLPLLMDGLFTEIERNNLDEKQPPLMRLQIVQLCAELVRDLIDVTKDNLPYEENVVKEPAVAGVTWVEIDSRSKGYEILKKVIRANQQSVETSYQSFCTDILTIEVTLEMSHMQKLGQTSPLDKNKEDMDSRPHTRKLTVVDTVGVELLQENVNSLIMREGHYLARSVSALKNAIEFFGTSRKTAPFDFTQSILTRHLWEEFGGNRKVHYLLLASPQHPNTNRRMFEMGQIMRKIEVAPVRGCARVGDVLVRLARRCGNRKLDDQFVDLVSTDPTSESLQNHIHTLLSKNADLTESLETYQSRAKDLSQRNARLEKTLEEMEKQSEEVKKRMEDLEKQAEQGLREGEKWKAKLEGHDRQEQLEFNEKSGQIRQLSAKVATLTTTVQKLEESNEEKDSRIGQMSTQISDLKLQVFEASEKFRNERSRCNELSLELAMIANRRNMAAKEQELAHQEMEKLKLHNDFLSKRLEKSRKVHFDAGERVNLMLEQEEERRLRMEEEKVFLEQKIRNLESEIRKLRKDLEEIRRLQDENDAFEVKYAHAIKERDAAWKREQECGEKLRNQDLEMVELRKNMESTKEERDSMACEFRSKLEAWIRELRLIVERTFTELFSSFAKTEKRLKDELEAAKRTTISAKREIDELRANLAGMVGKEDIKQH
ncbi:hypothetical protein HDU97_004208, partial [Phlyctochytrium planicorne]